MESPARQQLQLLLPWLEDRCRQRARGNRSLTEDLLQGSIELYLGKAERWFAQPPRVSLEAQAKHLLELCLSQASRVSGPELVLSSSTGAEENPDEPVDDRPLALELLEAEEDRAEEEGRLLAIELALATVSPTRRLAFVLRYHPGQLNDGLLEEAHRFRKGGGKGLARSIEETSRLLAELRERHPDPAEPAWWLAVTEVLRFAGPLGSAEPARLQTEKNNLDALASRVRKDLRRAVASRTVDDADAEDAT